MEFGFYLRGAILKGELTSLVEMTGIIPIQLVNSITDIEEISSLNKVSVDFAIDLAIFAI